MSLHLPTGSNWPRISICRASAAGLQIDRIDEHGSKGSGKHVYIATWLTGGDLDAARAAVEPEYQDACDRLAIESLPFKPGEVAVEVSLAYDVLLGEARELARGVGRSSYSAAFSTEIPMTLDAVGIVVHNGRRIVIVADWKSGHRRVSPAARNWQLKLAALAAARAYGCQAAEVLIGYVPEDEESFIDRASFGPEELDAIAVEVEQLSEEITEERQLFQLGKAPKQIATGAHCLPYCPRAATCVALTGALQAFAVKARDEAGAVPVIPGAGAPVELRRKLHGDIRLMRKLLDRLEAEEKVQASIEPFEIEPGLVFGPTRHETEKLVGPTVREVLERMHGPEVAAAAVALTSTKKAVTEALRRVAPKGKLADAERKFFEALGKAKGIESKVSAVVKEYRSDPALAKSKDAA